MNIVLYCVALSECAVYLGEEIKFVLFLHDNIIRL